MSMSEPQKRRGRPRVPEEERKRHTLTFRMRSDLREAVEELAEANGRTLSEQVEYYVDAAVFSEANLIYQYSTGAMSQALWRCVSSRLSDRESKEDGKLSVDLPKGPQEKLTIQGQTCLNHPHTEGSLPWTRVLGGKEDAVATARAMLAAIRKGAVDALVTTLGSEAVEAALIEERKAIQSEASNSDQPRLNEMNLHRIAPERPNLSRLLEEEVEYLRAEVCNFGGVFASPVQRDRIVMMALKKLYGVDWTPDNDERSVVSETGASFERSIESVEDEFARLLGRSIVRNAEQNVAQGQAVSSAAAQTPPKRQHG